MGDGQEEPHARKRMVDIAAGKLGKVDVHMQMTNDRAISHSNSIHRHHNLFKAPTSKQYKTDVITLASMTSVNNYIIRTSNGSVAGPEDNARSNAGSLSKTSNEDTNGFPIATAEATAALSCHGKVNGDPEPGNSGLANDFGTLQPSHQSQQASRNSDAELKHAREALAALKADRKRLKAEKFDLLNQMKQLYSTLEEKEKELRDFIRSYEQRMRESDEALRLLVTERDEAEREKWTVLRHAREEADRCGALSAQLVLKDTQIRQLQEELADMRRYSSARPSIVSQEPLLSRQDTLSSLSSTLVNSEATEIRLSPQPHPSSDSNEGPYIMVDRGSDSDSISLTSSHTFRAPLLESDAHCLTPCGIQIKNGEDSVLNAFSRSVEQISNGEGHSRNNRKTSSSQKGSISRGGPWGSISRVFARKQRRALDLDVFNNSSPEGRRSWSPRESLCATPLTEDSYTERLRLLDEAQHIPMDRWKAGHVLAWMEVGLGLPQCGQRCAENVKSGKILLELSDTEMETGLGLVHPLHRKKLRLAIEEHRNPALVRYPLLGVLGSTWVTSEWLPDLGLSQYTESFTACLMDARLLDTLTKRELEKYLGVSRKFHQASIVQAITFLRMMKYDRQAIAERRKQCESIDSDPIIWTNQRFIQWVRSIDLVEYAENLKDSGVHGALVVLEPSFSAETMATALGIPSSKNIVRRHLQTELDTLIQVPRARYEHRARQARLERRRAEKLSGGGSLGRSFSRSYTGGLSDRVEVSKPNEASSVQRISMRSSLSRALGIKAKVDLAKHAKNLFAASNSLDEHSEPVRVLDRPASVAAPSTSGDTNTVERHRRVKSSGDIETITVTRV